MNTQINTPKINSSIKKIKIMNINFTLCGADEIKTDLESIRSFKDRWISLISGWRDINDDEEDLKRTQTILTAEMVLENLLFAMEETENLTSKT